MIRKLCWLFVIYVVLRTFAPELAAVVVGMVVAVLLTAITMVSSVAAPMLSQVSKQDVTTGGAALFLTLVTIVTLWGWKPTLKRMRKIAK